PTHVILKSIAPSPPIVNLRPGRLFRQAKPQGSAAVRTGTLTYIITFQNISKFFRYFFIFSYESVHSFVTFLGYDNNKLKGTQHRVSQAL
ncbi:hypothetical protein, partial [Eisenbergiella tayi]|uniref:hypothetical protein n=1 Tax=Eisenbergiella tayi TaxID=1432052 RepID=UPI003AF100B4